MHSEIKQQLTRILRNRFLIDAGRLRAGKFLEDLGITDAEKKELFNLFEEEFQIQIKQKDERNIRTIRDTVFILQQYLNQNTSSIKTAPQL
jgi:acyl carrier protein